MKKNILILLFALISTMSYAQLNKQACQEIFDILDVKNATATLSMGGDKYDISEAKISFKETYLLIQDTYYREYKHTTRTYLTKKDVKLTLIIPYDKMLRMEFNSKGWFILRVLK